WPAGGDKAMTTLPHNNDVKSAAISPDGKWVVTGGNDDRSDRKARIFDAASGKLLIELPHAAPVSVVSFSPKAIWDEPRTNKWVVTAADQIVTVWDATTGKAVAEPLKHDAKVIAASFSPDGSFLVTATANTASAAGNAAYLYEAGSGKPVSEPLRHDRPITTASFSADGRFVATTSGDSSARVWLIALPGRSPEWLRNLVDVVGGYRLGQAGAAEPVTEPWKLYEDTRKVLASVSADDAFGVWGKWFLADRGARTISPFASTKMADFIARRVTEGTPGALNEVLELQPDNGVALVKLASRLKDTGKDNDQVDFISSLAEQYEPKNPEVLWLRAALLQDPLKQFPEAWAVMERALAAEPRNVTTFGPAGAEISQSNKEGHSSKGWLPKGWDDANANEAFNVAYTKLTDPPAGDLTAIRAAVAGSQARGQAQVRGPRFIARLNSTVTIDGWARSSIKNDQASILFRSFTEANTRFGETALKPGPEWKQFKASFKAPKDISGEVVLVEPLGGTVDVAGLTLRVE
ncbi:MAG: hypothetical protein HY300_15425, partial [Verrucomicrobia bacterium]|nr:hypothetical protein [Verrucomicrobiota bacterium]